MSQLNIKTHVFNLIQKEKEKRKNKKTDGVICFGNQKIFFFCFYYFIVNENRKCISSRSKNSFEVLHVQILQN